MKYEVNVCAQLSKLYDIEAKSEDEARAIAKSMLEKDTVAEGDWQKIEAVVDEITPCDKN